MKKKLCHQAILSFCLLIVACPYLLGQSSPEIGKWFTIVNTGDSVLYEFTADGRYTFHIAGGSPLVMLEDGSSTEPTLTPVLQYEVDYSITPHFIDFYDKSNKNADDDSSQVILKGIFEMISEKRMRICINRFGNRPANFTPDHPGDALILTRIPVEGI